VHHVGHALAVVGVFRGKLCVASLGAVECEFGIANGADGGEGALDRLGDGKLLAQQDGGAGVFLKDAGNLLLEFAIGQMILAPAEPS